MTRDPLAKILFVRHFSSTAKFVTNDIEILKKKFLVDCYDSKMKNSLSSVFSFLHLFIFLLFKIHKYKLVYIWFADYHSFLPVMFAKIFGKKSIIAVGGYDATYIPEIDMGVFTNATFKKRLRNFCATCSLKNASLILPVDKTLIENTNTYIYSGMPGKPVLKDGIRNMINGITTPMETVHLGYDHQLFQKDERVAKERAVVSAGFINNENEYRRKGFDLLVEAAKMMPDVKFILIGLNEQHFEMLRQLNLHNLELYGKVNYSKLIELYSRAKVYSQLSMFEGMPSSICEAMLCECIPVGSEVNGIPEIIGDTGVVVKEKNIDLVTEALRKVLDVDNEQGKKARERIVVKFPFNLREERLLFLVR